MFVFTPGFYYVDSSRDEQLDGRVCGQFHGYIYSVELMIHVQTVGWINGKFDCIDIQWKV